MKAHGISSKHIGKALYAIRKSKRRITKGERQGLFSGLAFYADCCGKFYFGTYSAHYIR